MVYIFWLMLFILRGENCYSLKQRPLLPSYQISKKTEKKC